MMPFSGSMRTTCCVSRFLYTTETATNTNKIKMKTTAAPIATFPPSLESDDASNTGGALTVEAVSSGVSETGEDPMGTVMVDCTAVDSGTVLAALTETLDMTVAALVSLPVGLVSPAIVVGLIDVVTIPLLIETCDVDPERVDVLADAGPLTDVEIVDNTPAVVETAAQCAPTDSAV